MGSYVWWAINQAAQRTSSWVATHQAEASLIAVGLANPATRGFVMDVVRIVGKETVRSWWNISRGIGSSAATRSSKVSAVASYAARAGRLLARNPIATVVAIDLLAATTAITLAQDEDPLTEQVQVKAVSQGISGTGQPSLGSWSPF